MVTKIILESPFKNSIKNKFSDNYFYLCVTARKMLMEGNQAPLFFHALYTQILNDNILAERELGLVRSFEFHADAENKTYAIDRGISKGMILGAKDAILRDIPIKFYTILPKDTKIYMQIEQINTVKNNEKRWILGLRFVAHLLKCEKNRVSFKKNGDLTLYKSYVSEELKEVKKCILDFFAPIVDSIREESKLENKDIKQKNKGFKNKRSMN